tara:strand:- start:5872 stop:6294 length:423 start_codon:yes stop_codon:yes gene_type:complete
LGQLRKEKMAAVSKTKIYSDLFTNFDQHPITDDVAVKTNEEAIKQSIRNLIQTNKGERLYQPNIGGDIKRLLFENNTPQTLILMREVIGEAIKAYEPRANVIDLVISPNEEQNAIAVSITFNVINRQEPVSLNVILDRVR